MVFSPLINGTAPHHGKYRRKSRKTRFVVHHWAGTQGGYERLTDPNQPASANYIILNDGRIIGQVPEEFEPWTTGPLGDQNSITVEVQNETGAPEWRISDAARGSLTRLIADCGQRNGWGELRVGRNVFRHRDFMSTSCPGPYVVSILNSVAVGANLINARNKPHRAEGNVYTVKPGDTLWEIANDNATTVEALSKLNNILDSDKINVGQKIKIRSAEDLDQVANDVIAGKYGNMPERKVRLETAGYNYDQIQSIVNRKLS